MRRCDCLVRCVFRLRCLVWLWLLLLSACAALSWVASLCCCVSAVLGAIFLWLLVSSQSNHDFGSLGSQHPIPAVSLTRSLTLTHSQRGLIMETLTAVRLLALRGARVGCSTGSPSCLCRPAVGKQNPAAMAPARRRVHLHDMRFTRALRPETLASEDQGAHRHISTAHAQTPPRALTLTRMLPQRSWAISCKRSSSSIRAIRPQCVPSRGPRAGPAWVRAPAVGINRGAPLPRTVPGCYSLQVSSGARP
jgi:hypothetical protein